MNKRFIIKKTKVVWRDNKALLIFLFSWFLGGFLMYFYVLKLDLSEALRASFFFKVIENDFSSAYGIWSQAIIFGVVFSFLTQNIFSKYNPERGCRMMAQELQDHIVVIGFSHFGERLVNHFIEKKIPYCLIEKNRDKVDELLNRGEAIIIDDARESDALRDASICRAKAVIIASNNLETALIVTKRARDCNKDCQIITRCFQDEFAEIIESLGASEVISSSKNAFEDTVKNIKI